MTRFPTGPEIALPAGDVTVGVVRIGDTVRRPHQPTSAAVAAYVEHLHTSGFVGAPRFLGRDERGRDVLTYLHGDVPGDPVPTWAIADDLLPGVARLVRRLHDASEGFIAAPRVHEPGRPEPRYPTGEPLLVAHRDITPQNTVFRDGVAWGIVDFDLCDYTTRATDLVNTAMHWVPLSDPVDRARTYDGIDVGRRLASMYDAYGRDHFDIDVLLEAARLRFADSYELMHWAAIHRGGGWARMWAAGVGEVIMRRVTWFDRSEPQLRSALTR